MEALRFIFDKPLLLNCRRRGSTSERIAATRPQADHILIEVTFVSSTFECEYGKGKKVMTAKRMVEGIGSGSIRKLNSGEKECCR